MINSVSGKFVVIDSNTNSPLYYWNGSHLTEVVKCVIHNFENVYTVKLKVLNTTNFDTIYAEMAAVGIEIKKRNNNG